MDNNEDKAKRRKDKKRGKDKEKREMPRNEPYKRQKLTLEELLRNDDDTDD